VHVATVGPAQSLQRLLERGEAKPCFRIVRRELQEHADAPHAFGLLRTRRDQPRSRRADETGDEIASPHGRCPSAEGNTLAHHGTTTAQCGMAKSADVRFGSKADIAPVKSDVRFTPESGHPSVGGYDHGIAPVAVAIFAAWLATRVLSRLIDWWHAMQRRRT